MHLSQTIPYCRCHPSPHFTHENTEVWGLLRTCPTHNQKEVELDSEPRSPIGLWRVPRTRRCTVKVTESISIPQAGGQLDFSHRAEDGGGGDPGEHPRKQHPGFLQKPPGDSPPLREAGAGWGCLGDLTSSKRRSLPEAQSPDLVLKLNESHDKSIRAGFSRLLPASGPPLPDDTF